MKFEWVGWITTAALIVLLVRTRAFGHHELALARKHIAAVLRRASDNVACQVMPQHKGTTSLAWERAWTELVCDATVRQAGGFELLLANRAAQLRYSWRNPAAPVGPTTNQPLVLAFTRPEGSFCQLHLLDLRAENVQHDLLPKVTALLDNLVLNWQSAGESALPDGLGVQCQRVAVEMYRQAA